MPASRCRNGGGRAGYIAADLADPGWTGRIAAAAQETLGGVDILIANTGGPPPGRMVDAELDLARRQVEAQA